MKPIVLLGATGVTGRRIARSLARLGLPFRVAGRRAGPVRAVAEATGALDHHVVDVGHPATLDAALRDASVVISTVGPFLAHGDAALDAALRAGVHYVDTSAEQPFLTRCFERVHAPARAAGLTFLVAHAVDFAPACAGVAILEDRLGPQTRLDSFHDLGAAFAPTRGTLRSMVGMMGTRAVSWRDGRFGALSRSPLPREELLVDTGITAAPFAGGDTVFVAHERPHVRQYTSNLVLPSADARGVAAAMAAQPLVRRLARPPVVRWLQRAVGRAPEPDDATLDHSPWEVTVQGHDEGAISWLRVRGPSIYGSSADLAAMASGWLAMGRARASGVCSTGVAFDAAAFLDAMGPCGLRWSMARARAHIVDRGPNTVAVEATLPVAPEAVWDALVSEGRWRWASRFAGIEGDLRADGQGRVLLWVGDDVAGIPVRFLAVEPGRELAWVGGARRVAEGMHRFCLTATDGGTHVLHTETFRGPGARALRRPAVRAAVEQAYWRATEELALYLTGPLVCRGGPT